MAYLLYGEAKESLRGLMKLNALGFTIIWLISSMEMHMRLKSVDQVKRLRFHGNMAYLLYEEKNEPLRGLIQ